MHFAQDIFLKFLNIKSVDYEKELEKALEQIGVLFELDRIYIYYFCEDPTFIKMEAQWNRKGIHPKRDVKEEEVAYALPWLMRRIKRDDLIAINDKEDLPLEALFEAEVFEKEGIQSALIIPLKVDDQLTGFIGYECVSKAVQWQEEQMKMLSQIPAIFSYKRASLLRDQTYQSVINGQAILLNNSESQIWALRNMTCYEMVNERHAEFFGKSKSELDHQDLYDVFDIETANKLSKTHWELFEKNAPHQKEVVLKNAQGEQRLLQIKSKPQRDSKGNIKYLICTAEDITQQRKAELRLHQAKEQAEVASITKGQFLANMSHEIRTPLNGILGFLEILQTTQLSVEQKEFIREAKSASQILLHLVNDILDFSKIEAKKLKLESIPFNLRTTIEDTLSLAAPKAAEKNLQIYAMIQENVPEEVVGDPSRLKQVLNNLISNGVKFTKKGEVSVTVGCQGEEDGSVLLCFEVKDTGIGIHKKDMDTIFESFNQADSSTTREYGGTGLGLAISNEIVKMMEGKILVESEYGKGSTFRFHAKLKVAHKEVEYNSGIESLQGKNVLIVDAHENSRKSISAHFQGLQINVFEAKDVAQAKDTLLSKAWTKNRIDVVVIDHQITERTPYEFAVELRKTSCGKDVKFILLTSMKQKEEAKMAKEYGFEGYLTKPVRKKDVLDALANAFGISKQQEEKIEVSESLQEKKSNLNPKILLVEDNPMNRKVIISMLKTRNMTCDIATNGEEALQVVAKKAYDIILMDCQMPVMDGYECTAKIRQLEGTKKHTPIIAITANAMEGDSKKCMEAGMDGYVTKPIHFETLFQSIENYTQNAIDIPQNTVQANSCDRNIVCDTSIVEDSIDELAKEAGLSKEDAKEILEDYIQCLPDLFLGIRSSMESKDFTTLAGLAHELKGSSGNLRIKPLYELSIQFEKAAKAQALEECQALFTQIEALFDK